MNEQETAWSGDFGNAYLRRNQVDWRARIPFWQIVERYGIRSVFEFGCSAGWNLSAIKRVAPDVSVRGADINEQSVRQARGALGDCIFIADPDPVYILERFELVFSCGVLIHIPPADLKQRMQSLIELSARYVMAIEYAADVETEVEYRGQMGLLWKRPFGRLYEDMGLVPIESGRLGKEFDNCRFWLLAKR